MMLKVSSNQALSAAKRQRIYTASFVDSEGKRTDATLDLGMFVFSFFFCHLFSSLRTEMGGGSVFLCGLAGEAERCQ